MDCWCSERTKWASKRMTHILSNYSALTIPPCNEDNKVMKSCWPTFRLLWETAQPSSRCRGRWGAQLLEWEQPRALHLSGSELTFLWGWAVVGWGEWGLKKCKAVFESWIAAVRGEVSRLSLPHHYYPELLCLFSPGPVTPSRCSQPSLLLLAPGKLGRRETRKAAGAAGWARNSPRWSVLYCCIFSIFLFSLLSCNLSCSHLITFWPCTCLVSFWYLFPWTSNLKWKN